jgi:Bifunctional DNA primase/polymerase, N-terminal/AAA domain
MIVGTETAASNLDAALALARLGFRIVPIHTWIDGRCTCDDPACGSPAKHPLTPRGLADATADEGTIRRWWTQAPAANIAIATGAESCVFMVGPDSIQGQQQLGDLASRFGELPLTTCERSGSGGGHQYYAWPADCEPIKNSKNSGGLALDIRGTGGYSICAPSVNRNGRYEWIIPPDRVMPAPAPKWLVAFARDPNGFLAQHGLFQPSPMPTPAVPQANGHANGQPAGSSPTLTLHVAQPPTIIDRARAYLAKTPPAISGQGGHDATFWAACCLVLGFNLSPVDALPLLLEWNDRCVPPWSEKELRHKLDSANQRPGERGKLLGDDRATSTPTAAATIGNGTAAREQQITRLERISTLDLLQNSPRPDWLVEHVLVDQQPAGILGSFKTLKTSIAGDLVISLATATPFLGHFVVPQARRVGAVSGESGRHTLSLLVQRIAKARDVDPYHDLQNLVWSTEIPNLTKGIDLERLRRFILDDALQVCSLDPQYLLLAGAARDAGNAYVMGELLAGLSQVGRDTGCTFVLVHHTSRGSSRARGFEPPELGDSAFAGTAEYLRQWICLGRRSHYEADSGRHELWVSVGGSAGQSGLYALDVQEGRLGADFKGRVWDVAIMRPDEAREGQVAATETAKQVKVDETVERDKMAILAAVEACPDRQGTRTEIRDRCGRNSRGFNFAFAALLRDRELVEFTTTKPSTGKRLWQTYKLAEIGG